jgi:predicted ABC-type ATPase
VRYVALRQPELNVNRVEARAARGGHYIDPDVVRARVSSSFGNLPRAVAIAHRTVIYDNSGKQHRAILDIEDGKIRQLAEMPSWLQTLRPSIEAALAGA